ncbi:hypothetical protein JCM10908_003896 [Rhodotorula pacifica]|uniref:uncharacterized protein n=1 Tax=Rhodotorula pacifica TaxID=1495444 RepID=UPI00317F6716
MEDTERTGQAGGALEGVHVDSAERGQGSPSSHDNLQQGDKGGAARFRTGGTSQQRGDAVKASDPSTETDAVRDQTMEGTDAAQTVPNGATGPASTGSTSPAPSTPGSSHLPLPPLPLEVFLRVMEFLDPLEVVRSRRVSSLWYSSISGEPRLWRDIECSLIDDLTDQLALYSACARPRATGQSGGIVSLSITLEGMPVGGGHGVADIVSVQQATSAFEQIVNAVSQVSIIATKAVRGPLARQGGFIYESSLRTLRIRLDPQSGVTLSILQKLAQNRSHPLFGQLESLDLYAGIPGLPLGEYFLSMFPTLSSLRLRGFPLKHVVTGNWAWTHDDADAADLPLRNLREIVLRDVRVAAPTAIPPLPALARFYARNVCWETRSYYLLFRIARKTLEHLELASMVFYDVGEPEEDYQDYLDVRQPHLLDLPPRGIEVDHMLALAPLPIYMPELKYLKVSGLSPTIWSPEYGSDDPSDYADLPTPFLVMPSLDNCDLTDVVVDAIEELDQGIGPLALLGKLAPNVSRLCLHGVVTDDLALWTCLNEMHGRLTRLDLSDSSASDHVICHLPRFAPMLRELDVRGCVEISVQGVARVVEVIRRFHDEGQSKVERVWVDPPVDGWAEFQAYEWLAFIDVLQRDEFDYEGLGPSHPKERREWIKRGKKDVMHDYKLKYKAWENAQAVKRLAKQKQAAGSSSRSANVAAPQAAVLTPLPAQLVQRISNTVLSMAPSAPSATPAPGPASTLSQTSFPAEVSAVPNPSSPATRGNANQTPAAPAQMPAAMSATIPQQTSVGAGNTVPAAASQPAGLSVKGVVADMASQMPDLTTWSAAPQDLALRVKASLPPSVQYHAYSALSSNAFSSMVQAAIADYASPASALRQQQQQPPLASAISSARMQPHTPSRSKPPFAPPPLVPKTASSPPKPKVDSTESLDFDVGNVDAGFLAAQARELIRLEQAQAARMQAQIDEAERGGGGGGGGGTARAKLQKMYQEQQRQLQGGGTPAMLPARPKRTLIDDQDVDEAVPAWEALNAASDEDEPVAEVIISDEEEVVKSTAAPTIPPQPTAPVYGFAAGESDEDDDEDVELQVVPADAATQPPANDFSIDGTPIPDPEASDPFVPLV